MLTRAREFYFSAIQLKMQMFSLVNLQCKVSFLTVQRAYVGRAKEEQRIWWRKKERDKREEGRKMRRNIST
jgi:hypothetical protein